MKIGKMFDVFVIEKWDGNTILKGSKIFCGCCGGSVGKLKRDLELPCDEKTFRESLIDRSYEKRLWGILHTKCNHTLFGFSSHIEFITQETYKQEIN